MGELTLTQIMHIHINDLVVKLACESQGDHLTTTIAGSDSQTFMDEVMF